MLKRILKLCVLLLISTACYAQYPAFVQISPVVAVNNSQTCTATFPNPNTAGNTTFFLITSNQTPVNVGSVVDQLQGNYIPIFGPPAIGSAGVGVLYQGSPAVSGNNAITGTFQQVVTAASCVAVEYSPAAVVYYGIPQVAGNGTTVAISGLLASQASTLLLFVTTNVTGTTTIIPPGPAPFRGTPLTPSNFALGAGWGSTAQVTAVNGTDSAFSFTITSTGTGQALGATAVLTFVNGAYPSTPLYQCVQTGGTGTIADVEFTGGSATTTTLPMIWNSTPVAGLTYELTCTGSSNLSGTTTVTTTGGATITAGAGFTLRTGTGGLSVQDRANVNAGTYATGPAYPTISTTAQWGAFFLALQVPPANMTTVTGTIRDLSGNPVPSGQITFTLKPGTDTTLASNARFTPSVVNCSLQSFGLIRNASNTGPCLIATSTAIIPTGTYYSVTINPNSLSSLTSSTFNMYATGSSVDITTITPTPAQMPQYNLVDTFSNQTIGGNKTFTGIVTLAGGSQLIINGPLNALNGGDLSGNFLGNPVFTGNPIFYTVPQINNNFYVAQGSGYPGINAIDTATSGAPANIFVNFPGSYCGGNVNLTNGHILNFGPGIYQINIVAQDSLTTNVTWGLHGTGRNQTILQACPGSGTPVLTTTNFATLTGGTNFYGVFNPNISDFTCDGNSTSPMCIEIYGKAVSMENIWEYGATSSINGGIWLEWGGTENDTSAATSVNGQADNLEADFNAGDGFVFKGTTGAVNAIGTIIGHNNGGWGIQSDSNLTISQGNLYENTQGGFDCESGGAVTATNAAFDTGAAGIGVWLESGCGLSHFANAVIGGNVPLRVSGGGGVTATGLIGNPGAGQPCVQMSGGGNIQLSAIVFLGCTTAMVSFTGEATPASISGTSNITTTCYLGTPGAADYVMLINPGSQDCVQIPGNIAMSGNSVSFPPHVNQFAGANTFAGFCAIGSTCVHTFSTAYNNAPVCTATDVSAIQPVKLISTTTGFTITGTGSDNVAWICIGDPN